MYQYTIIDVIEVTSIKDRHDEHYYKSEEEMEADKKFLEETLGASVKIKSRKVFMMEVEE